MGKDYDYEIEFNDEGDDLETNDGKDPWGQTFDDYIDDCEGWNPGSTGYTSDFD